MSDITKRCQNNTLRIRFAMTGDPILQIGNDILSRTSYFSISCDQDIEKELKYAEDLRAYSITVENFCDVTVITASKKSNCTGTNPVTVPPVTGNWELGGEKQSIKYLEIDVKVSEVKEKVSRDAMLAR